MLWTAPGCGRGCGRAERGWPLGSDLRGLPRAGSQPLLALVPPQASAVVAVSNAAATLRAWEATPLWQQAEAAGLFGGELSALPPVERWQALQERLAELARVPLPGAGAWSRALLDAPAVLAWLPGKGEERAGALLYVASLDEKVGGLWALAQVLNAVRPSGRDVELARVSGLAVRQVAFGEGHLFYALLADRLLIATDPQLIAAAVSLALQPGGRSAASLSAFADLEARALVVGVAAAFQPAGATWLPGLKSAELEGSELSMQLEGELWANASQRTAVDPASLLNVGLPGLDAAKAYAKLRPSLSGGAGSSALLERLDVLAPTLSRGVFLDVVSWPSRSESGVGVTMDVLRSGTDDSASAALVQALLDAPGPRQALSRGGLWCAQAEDVCLASCAGALRLAWPGSYARARGCPELRTAAPAELVLRAGGAVPLVSLELRDGRGRFDFGGQP